MLLILNRGCEVLALGSKVRRNKISKLEYVSFFVKAASYDFPREILS